MDSFASYLQVHVHFHRCNCEHRFSIFAGACAGHTGVTGRPGEYSDIPGVENVSRWRKGAKKWELATLPCPPAVCFYQKYMRGVDLADAVSNNACLEYCVINVCVTN